MPCTGYAGYTDAGWSSSVARWAHNPEVAGSNPVPATIRKAGREIFRLFAFLPRPSLTSHRLLAP